MGDQFLLLTTLTILLTIAFPRYFERLRGTQEIGTYLIYLFFVVIGIPADLRIILMNAPLLLAFVFVVAMSNVWNMPMICRPILPVHWKPYPERSPDHKRSRRLFRESAAFFAFKPG